MTDDSQDIPPAPEKNEEELQKYLSNKSRGGRNNEKGNDLEHCFAIFQIAKHASQRLFEGKDFHITSQRAGYFVDDLVIEEIEGVSVKCFQIKDVESLSWQTLLFDFYHQNKITQEKTLELAVVVSRTKVSETLESTRGKREYSHLPPTVKVMLFPTGKGFSTLISHQELAKMLNSIANKADLTMGEMETMVKLLSGEWLGAAKETNVSSLLLATSLRPFLRSDLSATGDERIFTMRASVEAILNNVPYLKWRIDRGFLHCDYLGTTMTLGFDCFSDEFETVQRWIEEARPKDFEGDLERMLTTWCKKLS